MEVACLGAIVVLLSFSFFPAPFTNPEPHGSDRAEGISPMQELILAPNQDRAGTDHEKRYKKETSEISIETINRSRIGKRLASLMYALLFVGSVIPCTVTGSNTYCAAANPPEAST